MAHSGTIKTTSPANVGLTFGTQARLVPARTRRSLQVSNAVKDVFMPALSSTMTEGKIVSWLKSPGDKVKKGESIVVVESGEYRRKIYDA
jgi:pyruvate dehydrogenase E2 component (dihydrolipoamide acetyltransferase)